MTLDYLLLNVSSWVFHCWTLRIEIVLRGATLAVLLDHGLLLGKTAYKLRVRRLVRSRSFQRIAANVAMGLKKTCKEVIRKRGAAAGR